MPSKATGSSITPASLPDEKLPDASRQQILSDLIRANIDAGRTPFQGIRLHTRGEVKWLLEQGNQAIGTSLDSDDAPDTNLDLRGVILRGVILGDIDLHAADLRTADLSHCDLSSATLRGAFLEGTNLQGATVYGTDLSDSEMHTRTN